MFKDAGDLQMTRKENAQLVGTSEAGPTLQTISRTRFDFCCKLIGAETVFSVGVCPASVPIRAPHSTGSSRYYRRANKYVLNSLGF